MSFFTAKKSFIGQNKSIWGPLELTEKLCPESVSIATSARDLPGIRYAITHRFLNEFRIEGMFNLVVLAFRTGLGRARAWLHLALMQKKVADYMKAVLDRKDLLRLVGANHLCGFCTKQVLFQNVLYVFTPTF